MSLPAEGPSLSISSELLVLVRVLVHGVIFVLWDVLEVNVAVLVLQQLGELLEREIRVRHMSEIRHVCDIIDWDSLSWFCVSTAPVTCHVTVTRILDSGQGSNDGCCLQIPI